MIFPCALIIYLLASQTLVSALSAQDDFLGLWSEKNRPQKLEFFHDLGLVRPEALVGRNLSLELHKIASRESMSLVSLARKKSWLKQYRSLNQYVEDKIDSGLGPLSSQGAIFYRFDNISQPVLIRAFDVVIDDNTCISITIQCDVRDWPKLAQEVTSLLSSLVLRTK